MNSPLFNAIEWLAGILTGSAATGLAVICVSVLGIATLGGHFDRRQALRVLLGMFLLFAAPTLAISLQDLFVDDSTQSSAGSHDNAKTTVQAICWTCG